MNNSDKIQLNDLQAQQLRIAEEIHKAINNVLQHGQYIQGPEVRVLEQKLSEHAGAKHTISCSSGTDALLLVLMAKGIKQGDAVFVPSFTFVSTAEAVALTGATPFFIDVCEDTYLINLESLQHGVSQARKIGLQPRAIIPVDLFGQPADYEQINQLAESEDLFVLADAAQSYGAIRGGKRTGTLAYVTATSFFPAKPLGCYGDGGAVFTNDDELASDILSLRSHGKGEGKYDNIRIGINGRLDTIQAAILIEKLKIFDEEMNGKQKIADYYSKNFSSTIIVPFIETKNKSAWSQYTIQVDNRQKLVDALKKQGVPSAVYYTKPLHLQGAYINYPRTSRELPVSEKLSEKVISLPMHAYITKSQQDIIINIINQCC